MNVFFQDLRYGLRVLARNPGFAAVAVLTLALGIGANTAIFTVVNAVLLKPLPYEEPSRLMLIQDFKERGPSRAFTNLSYLNYLDLKRQSRGFERMGVFARTGFVVGGSEGSRMAPAQVVSSDFLPTLGVEPRLGRLHTPEEDQPGSEPVVLLSHGFWERRFASDPDVLGQSLELSGESHTIIGVLSRDFEPVYDFPRDSELYVPLAARPNNTPYRESRWLTAIGRLKPGVTEKQAQEELNTIAARLAQEYPDLNEGKSFRQIPLHQAVAGHVRPALVVLLGAVGFVLLIACANVANLLLARGVTRQKEIAIRAALGAGRLRLLRQLLTESLVLSLGGGAVGVLLAAWIVDAVIALNPGGIPRIEQASLDLTLLGFAFALSLLTGLLFGMVPALRASSANLQVGLKEAPLSGSDPSHRLRAALVVSEVALTLILLVGAGLLANSLARLLGVDPGFRVNNVLAVTAMFPPGKYAQDFQRALFVRGLLEEFVAAPQVRSAAAVNFLPLASGYSNAGVRPGEFAEGYSGGATQESVRIEYRLATPGYFRTVGIPLLRGRSLTDTDPQNAPQEAVISQSLARILWPGENPIGRRLRLGSPEEPWVPVVGVVGDIHHYGLDREPTPTLYRPLWSNRGAFTIVLRTDGEPSDLAGPVRAQIRRVDPEMVVLSIRPMRELYSNSVAEPRFNAFLLGSFALIALLLAAVGVYGVISYSATRRTHEIGIRMAMGAQRGDVFRLILGRGVALILLGIGIGLAGALGLSRFLSSLLFGVTAGDPTTFALVSALLVGVALLACYLPARRATRVDPMVALRYE